MSEHRDEKWLDERLQRAVSGDTPVFDAQAWKQRYAGAYQTLTGRGNRWGKPTLAMRLLRGPFGKIAIAAAIVVAAGLLLFGQFRSVPETLPHGPQPVAQESPAQMVSMFSLSAAFRSGGMEGLDKQWDQALKRLGPRPTSVSRQELLRDIENKG